MLFYLQIHETLFVSFSSHIASFGEVTGCDLPETSTFGFPEIHGIVYLAPVWATKSDFGVKKICRNLIRETQQTKATHDALATVRIRRPGKRRGRRCCRQGGGGCRVGPDGLAEGEILGD